MQNSPPSCWPAGTARAWEYDAKQALLKYGEKLGLSYEEYIETEKQLQQVINNEYGAY